MSSIINWTSSIPRLSLTLPSSLTSIISFKTLDYNSSEMVSKPFFIDGIKNITFIKLTTIIFWWNFNIIVSIYWEGIILSHSSIDPCLKIPLLNLQNRCFSNSHSVDYSLILMIQYYNLSWVINASRLSAIQHRHHLHDH